MKKHYTVLAIVMFLVIVAVSIVSTRQKREGFNQQDTTNFPMFIINLDRRPDRLQESLRLLGSKGFTGITKIQATDGTSEWDKYKHLVVPDAMEAIYNGYRTAHNQLSKGAVGCYLSHVKTWNYLIKSVHDGFFIFEDDTLPTLTLTDVRTKMRRVPADWDVVLFGAVYEQCLNINETVCKIKRFFCLHAYAIRKKAAERLVSNALPISQQVDFWMSDMSEKGELNIYALRNSDWIQNTRINSTDIQTPMIDNGDHNSEHDHNSDHDSESRSGWPNQHHYPDTS